MPYLIVTSQAKLVNTYVCGPMVVGDKNADAKLMKAVGARLVTNYPACGSPPLYVVYGHPRGILEKLEDAGYTLISTSVAGDCRECILWTLYSPGGYPDPNTKCVQTSETDLEGSRSSSQQRSSQEERRSSAKKSPRASTEQAEPPEAKEEGEEQE